MNEFDVIVVGAGAMGSAAAYHLACDGRSVLLVEQFEIGHNRGASHGHSRIIRLSYDHPTYVRLSKLSYALWAELEADAGEKVITTTGGLDLSKPGHPAFEACISSMNEVGIDYELLDAAEIRRRYPQFRIEPGTVGAFQKDAGILNPSQCVPLMVRMAEKHGATILDRTGVTGFHFDEDSIEVACGDRKYRSAKLVITPGPWAEPLLSKIGLAVPVRVTEERYVFFRPPDPELFSIGRFPIFAQYGQNRNGPDIEFYGFPVFGLDGVKVAEHHFGPPVTADSRSFDVPEETIERLRHRMQALVPQALGEVVHAMTCLYSLTPDRNFIIDLLPGYPGIAIAAGFSGHGFKFAIAVGRILADLVEKGRSDFPIDLLRLSRFVTR
ncbi:MAG TPA: N-methyl-L-tryptophan oxidase [Candidatus Obscuribacterales bacterium]